MPDPVGTLAVALYGALLSSATAASQFYQLVRKRRRYGYTFAHHPVRIHDDVGYIDDYLVNAVIINKSESEITVLRSHFGIDKVNAGKFPRHNLEGYGKDGAVEFPFVIPGMSAKVLYSFARHWRRDDTLEKIPEEEWGSYRLYFTIQIVGDDKERVVEIPDAGLARISHRIECIGARILRELCCDHRFSRTHRKPQCRQTVTPRCWNFHPSQAAR